jgi:cell division protein ZapA
MVPRMDRRTVQLRVAGQSYKVVSSAPDNELERLAATVDAKVSEVTPRGRAASPQSMLLAAISLAHELESERGRREALEVKTRDLMRRVLLRIDQALEDGDGDAPPAGSLEERDVRDERDERDG